MFGNKKKIFKVEFVDRFNDYGCIVVNASDPAKAWDKAVRKSGGKSLYPSPYAATILTRISEMSSSEV